MIDGQAGRRISFAQALVEALLEEMRADASIYLVGSYLLGLGPKRVLMDQVRAEFPARVWDPPISEAAAAGFGLGAALAGLRPIVDLGTASFMYNAFAQVVNEAANARYMSGGQLAAPLVFHALHGLRGGGAAQHSASPHAQLWNAPGLEIVLPASPYDAKGLLHAAIRSGNPTVVLNHSRLLDLEGPVPAEPYVVPLGQAEIKRPGRDLSLVATSYMVQRCLSAAEALATDGVSAEVVDLRTLVPLDRQTLLGSVARTGRVVIVDEAHLSAGASAEIAALIAQEGFHALRAPIERVATADVPIPFSPPLEEAVAPTVERIRRAALTVVGEGAPVGRTR